VRLALVLRLGLTMPADRVDPHHSDLETARNLDKRVCAIKTAAMLAEFQVVADRAAVTNKLEECALIEARFELSVNYLPHTTPHEINDSASHADRFRTPSATV
jgi:hypothetical protein